MAHAGWHRRGYLPHFDAPQAMHALTYRLADAIPQDALERIQRQHAAFPDDERARRLRSAIERFSDAGAGSCVLADPRCARIVRDNWQHFAGRRYHLIAWVIMPNHAHVLIQVLAGHPLPRIVNSWKSYTSSRINRLLGRSGALWMPDYWDRYIRDAAHAKACLHYIEQNPVSAGLMARAEDWAWSSAAQREGGPAGRVPDGESSQDLVASYKGGPAGRVPDGESPR